MGRLLGRRILVVGASKGIGRVIGRRLVDEGAQVAFAARSRHLLEQVVADCATGAIAVECDVRDEQACQSAVDETVAAFGGLDALVYSTGMYPFMELADATSEDWRMVLETNLIGSALVTRAALPYLKESHGHAIYLSSNSASYAPPWRGIGLYITSKVALEKLVRCWEVENPEVAFTAHVVGPTTGETAPAATPDLTPEELVKQGEFTAEWFAKGYVTANLLPPESHADAVVSVLTSPGRIEQISVVPR